MNSLTICCCNKIGYDGPRWSSFHERCFGKRDYVEHIGGDIAKLNEVKFLFAGNDNICAAAMRYLAIDKWDFVANWIRNGGRMWLQGEWGNPSIAGAPGCLSDPVAVNSFLATIGSSIQWIGKQYANGAGCDFGKGATCDPGGAKISAGGALEIALAAEVDGGISVWRMATYAPVPPVTGEIYGNGKTVVAGERLGSGFIFLTGDSNISGGCPAFMADNCAFFNKLVDSSDDKIL